MLLQEEMIARVREVCAQDERVVAAWMYGSFTKGEGDRFSDIEFLLYLYEAAHSTVDPATWVAQIAPVAVYFVNEFGVGTAIFENLIRGEFHFDRASDMSKIRAFKATAGFPPVDAMLILDRTGELTSHLQVLSGPGPERASAENLASLWNSLLNWMLFGINVLARGERIRALELLGAAHHQLLWLARVCEGTTEHWFMPSKNAERDLSPAALARFAECTATLDDASLERAYRAAWTWGKELARALAKVQPFDVHESLIQRLDVRVEEAWAGSRVAKIQCGKSMN